MVCADEEEALELISVHADKHERHSFWAVGLQEKVRAAAGEEPEEQKEDTASHFNPVLALSSRVRPWCAVCTA